MNLWSDGRIAERARQLDGELYDGNTRPWQHYMIVWQTLAFEMRDEYQAEIDRLKAETWEPVKDGFEIGCEGSTSWKLYASEGDIGVVNSDDRAREHYVYAAPHNLRLCQRRGDST